MPFSYSLLLIVLIKSTRCTTSANSDLNVYTSLEKEHCYKSSKCEQLRNNSCFDVILPYKFTTRVETFGDVRFASQDEIYDYLARWRILQSVPRCWIKLQSLLCTSLLPKCVNDRVNLPSLELCKFTLGPCGVLLQNLGGEIPAFLRCTNLSLFPPRCPNEYTDLKFNVSSARCSAPLVGTDDPTIWYPNFDGCALHCQDPMYTSQELKDIERFIFRGSLISFLATFFCVSTFLIDWKSSNRYPPVIIFYLNVCVMATNLGWFLQFLVPEGKEGIVCRSDRTTRYGSHASEGYCSFVFLLTYYFYVAGLVWFVNFAYAWDRFFKRINAIRERDSKSAAYYHLSAWCTPVLFMVIIIILNEIDGNWVLGICFVGFQKGLMRFVFVLLPASLALIIGCFFMIKCMVTLMRAKSKAAMVAKSRVYAKIKYNLLRIGLFIMFAFASLICTFVCHIYEYYNYGRWSKALNDNIICSLNLTSAIYPHEKPSECVLESRPSVNYTYAQLIAVFGVGIATSSWVWTTATFSTWKRCFRKKCSSNNDGPVRLKKHEVISKAWNRRDAISKGCYSPSFHSVHEDPVAMNLTSATSQELSSTWATALPNFLSRRGAIAEYVNVNHYLNNYNANNNQSSISDVSQQRCSLDSFGSRRESQVSLEHELAAIVRHQRRKTKKEREKLLRSHKKYIIGLRRGSDTSSQSLVSSAYAKGLLKPQRTVTKSTSTGDLQQNTPQPPLPPLNIPKYQPVNVFPAQPVLTSSVAQYSQPEGSTYPVLTPTVTHVQHYKTPKPQNTSHPFTHGMFEQTDGLVNPFVEKRRPENHCLTSSTNNLSGHNPLADFPSIFSNGNFGFSSCNYNGFPYPQMQVPFYPSYATPYFPTSNLLSGIPPNPQYSNYVNSIPVFSSTPQPSFLPCPVGPVNQHSNLEELQASIREREAYLPLIAPVDSSSDVGDFLPIQLSDSDGFFTDGGAGQPINDSKATQRLVDEHIQRVEAEAEAKANGDAHSSDGKDSVGIRKIVAKSSKEKKKKFLQKRNSFRVGRERSFRGSDDLKHERIRRITS